MARGGKREGSGRPPGAINKASAARQAEISESGLTPLEYMISVMRDPDAEVTRRLDAAKAAAPYVHPRLSAVEHSGEMSVISHEQFIAECK